ncbi:MAG TPA: PPOX class F420-dependent oxidoreductase [Mycobacteriales bacterium]|nr:PPOX class F420-dependent oxidoreductase [Mycobacteriales bacterium]
MEVAAAIDFIRSNHRAVLATLRQDGGPQLTPVAVTVDANGDVVVSSRETAAKVKNLRRHARCWVTVMNDAFYGDFVQVEGPVTLVALPEAMDGLVEYYRSISGEHPDWDDYRAAMEREQRVLIKISVTRAGPKYIG